MEDEINKENQAESAEYNEDDEDNESKPLDLRKIALTPGFIMDICMALDNKFTECEACEYIAHKLNTDPEKVRMRVMMVLKKGRSDGMLTLRRNMYSLAGVSDDEFDFQEPSDRCGRKKKSDPMACFKEKKKRRRRSCKPKKKSCKPKRKRRKSSCPKKRKSQCPKKKPQCPKKKKPSCGPCSKIAMESE